MSAETKVAHQRLRVLQFAKTLGNIAAAGLPPAFPLPFLSNRFSSSSTCGLGRRLCWAGRMMYPQSMWRVGPRTAPTVCLRCRPLPRDLSCPAASRRFPV